VSSTSSVRRCRELSEAQAFDLAWLPGAFLPGASDSRGAGADSRGVAAGWLADIRDAQIRGRCAGRRTRAFADGASRWLPLARARDRGAVAAGRIRGNPRPAQPARRLDGHDRCPPRLTVERSLHRCPCRGDVGMISSSQACPIEVTATSCREPPTRGRADTHRLLFIDAHLGTVKRSGMWIRRSGVRR
jgi:hypothetical protein